MKEEPERLFYERLPAGAVFDALIGEADYEALPNGWQIVLTDVEDSTRAVAAGRYKEVNLVGAASIIAAGNALGSGRHFPYVFGGDGASMAVDGRDAEPLRRAMLGVKAMAKESFGLRLRVGAVGVRELREAGADVRVAKLTVRGRFTQAAFTGGGLRLAEQWMKAPGSRHVWPEPGQVGEADFTGLECRWQPLETERGGYLCLLAASVKEEPRERRAFYEAVAALLRDILGTDLNPVPQSRLRLATSPSDLAGETAVVCVGQSTWQRRLHTWKTFAQTRIGGLLGRLGWRLPGFDLPRYFAEIPQHTDYRKFDDALRMVVAAGEAESVEVRKGLERLRQQGAGVYGLHLSPQALLTCLVFDREERHLHFLDGADGGYVQAAKEMKAQLVQSA